VASFTRQVLYLRPDTFVIFDRVESTRADFQKKWLLQAMDTPRAVQPGEDERLVVTNGAGRLVIQTLLPRAYKVVLRDGPDLYRYGGEAYPPSRDTGKAPSCRVEISPALPATVDYFLHVLTATNASAAPVPAASVVEEDGSVTVSVGAMQAQFTRDSVGGTLRLNGADHRLKNGVRATPDFPGR
jgi:heparin/heparan-sulfate lyase